MSEQNDSLDGWTAMKGVKMPLEPFPELLAFLEFYKTASPDPNEQEKAQYMDLIGAIFPRLREMPLPDQIAWLRYILDVVVVFERAVAR